MSHESPPPFWKTKKLSEMTPEEWESVCDGCGICCLEKLENKQTGEVEYTAIACEFLDTGTCLCKIYEDRYVINKNCIRLTYKKVRKISWLPETCAYRLIEDGEDLPWWHPLISGNPKTVHRAGISVRYKAVSIVDIHPEDLPDFLR